MVPGTIRFPIQIAAAVEISTACDSHGQGVSLGIGGSDQIGTRLADIVGMLSLQRSVFSIGQ